MTKPEFDKRLEEFKIDFNYCIATNNGLEASKIVREMNLFIKTNKHLVK